MRSSKTKKPQLGTPSTATLCLMHHTSSRRTTQSACAGLPLRNCTIASHHCSLSSSCVHKVWSWTPRHPSDWRRDGCKALHCPQMQSNIFPQCGAHTLSSGCTRPQVLGPGRHATPSDCHRESCVVLPPDAKQHQSVPTHEWVAHAHRCWALDATPPPATGAATAAWCCPRPWSWEHWGLARAALLMQQQVRVWVFTRVCSCSSSYRQRMLCTAAAAGAAGQMESMFGATAAGHRCNPYALFVTQEWIGRVG